MAELKNVLGQPLQACCFSPLTGYFRDGWCKTDEQDHGSHVVCVKVSEEFLLFSRMQGNDLSTPVPDYRFRGLKQGDKWCLCALRWKEAFDAGMAPSVFLSATHERALEFISLADLQEHAAD